MCVGSVSGDDHIMPLVIVQWVVTVSLQQAWPIPQVKHIVDKAGREEAQQMSLLVYICVCVVAICLFIFPDY